jgi:hypothetical protein
MRASFWAASLLSAVIAPSVWADELAQVSGTVGSSKFSFRAIATMEESLAALQNPFSNVPAEFGVTTVYDRLGFRQLVHRNDKSAMLLVLALPPEMAKSLKPGVYELGNTSVEHDKQGWSSLCPDLEQNKPLFSVTYYSAPGPNSMPPMHNVPAGDFVSYEQTHHTRIRHDRAALIVRSIDVAHRFIEGEIQGEISSIVPKDPPAKWLCSPAEFIVKTEPFKVVFKMQLAKSWPR